MCSRTAALLVLLLLATASTTTSTTHLDFEERAARPRRNAVSRSARVRQSLLSPSRALQVVDGTLTVTLLGEDFTFIDLQERSGLTTGTGDFYIGTVQGYPLSEVELSFTDGMSGVVRLPDRYIQILAQGDGETEVTELQTDQIAEGDSPMTPAEPTKPNITDVDALPPTASRAADATSTVHMAVFYTARAALENGGDEGTRNLVTLIEGDVNTGFLNTGLATRVRVVHVQEVDYDEDLGDWKDNLDRFTLTADGYMDEVHAVREAYGADVCMLLVAPTDDDMTTGIGWIAASYSYAFSVCENQYAATTTAAHEIGHNLGCYHDRTADARTRIVADWARGYRNEDARVTTLLSYVCDNCTRISVHSRPEPYDGIVIGDENNDCARRIVERTPTLSAFLPAVDVKKEEPTLPPTPTPTPVPRRNKRNNCLMLGPSTFGEQLVVLRVVNYKRARLVVVYMNERNRPRRLGFVRPGRRVRITAPQGTVFRIKKAHRRWKCFRSFKLNESKTMRFV